MPAFPAAKVSAMAIASPGLTVLGVASVVRVFAAVAVDGSESMVVPDTFAVRVAESLTVAPLHCFRMVNLGLQNWKAL